ncbi:hypothetical protein B4079_4778 [Bacillus cereus]|nr:hypothetical protein B4079_4778 [Bacillus cereus]KZD43333.1 hypothetical protein B4085_5469 [Bacillus cereus]KZD68577.1 hypothetical protein B4116_0597 [Bacillus cereus]KZD82633.1 hypothetical protein B4120_1520 [Bacillus cereus]
MLEIGFGFGRETTVAWKVTVREAPLLIVPRDIPAAGFAFVCGMLSTITVPGIKEVPLGRMSVKITLLAGRSPVLGIVTV